MSHYSIESNQMELMIKYMKLLLISRRETISRVEALAQGYVVQPEEDPVGLMIDILSDICHAPPPGDEGRISDQAGDGVSIPDWCGTWVSDRPKRLLILYPGDGGWTAALTRPVLLGLRTEFIPVGRMEYDRREDTVTLDGKIVFRRIYDGLSPGSRPQTEKTRNPETPKKSHETLR